MENSKKYLQNNNILPKISFKGGEAHTVKLIEDKEDSIETETGEIKKGVRYKVIEGGVAKTFFTGSIGLIQALAEKPEETEVIIQLKSKKGKDGFISYYDVKVVGQEDIPIVEDDEELPNFPE